jgi:hypothetical protein
VKMSVAVAKSGNSYILAGISLDFSADSECYSPLYGQVDAVDISSVCNPGPY